MAEHEHGTMSTEVQEQTFTGFVKASSYVAIAAIVILILAGLING